jgi:ATP-dependent helicase/nuclease subunit B
LEGIHKIRHQIITPYVPIIEKQLNTISKNEDVIEKLIKVAEKGFSPSSLTNYIRNPIDFYNQKVLGIYEYEDAEETVAANTLGTVVHNTLEDFYKPLAGMYLTVDLITNLKSQIQDTVTIHFKKVYKEGDITRGKNLIIFEIAKRYVSNFLDLEIADLKAGNSIKIIAVEANKNVSINIPEIPFPVNLTGKVDRIDEYNGTVRIIDYKTGKVQQNQVEVVNWEDITTNYDAYSKSFQILTYVYMMHLSGDIELPVEAGVISFKNLNSGFLRFAKKNKSGVGAKKEHLINKDILDAFQEELKHLITEICDPNIDFTEKEI